MDPIILGACARADVRNKLAVILAALEHLNRHAVVADDCAVVADDCAAIDDATTALEELVTLLAPAASPLAVRALELATIHERLVYWLITIATRQTVPIGALELLGALGYAPGSERAQRMCALGEPTAASRS